ncbi:ribbon-helix-helix domain-containing protein [Methylobacterium sp. 1030]|uniref:ribbon-helix-helix domain-containing protein n=1 Tax=Methylobacterium sp. 1030 TaxID=3156404 RepID=UPI003397769F
MSKKVDFAAGLAAKRQAEFPMLQPEPAEKKAHNLPPSRLTATGDKKVAISAYFEPEVLKQFKILAVRQDKSQSALLAEALNLLFEKYGESPIARA